MGIVSCPLPCHSKNKSESSSQSQYLDHPVYSDSTSLTTQPSLPSVPSLSEHQLTTHHKCISTLKGHSTYVSSVALCGKFLYSASSDKQIRLWNREPFGQEEQLFCQDSTNNVVVSSKSGVKSLVISCNKLFSAHQDNKIRVWQIKNNGHHHHSYKKLASLPTITDRLTKLVSSSNYVQVRRHKKCTWVHHVDAVSSLAISTDGSLLYSASWDRSFKIWRTSDFKCLQSIDNAHDDAINSVLVSNTGFVYTGSADKTIKVWKKLDGEKKHSLVANLEKHKSAVNALALGHNETTLYSGACDRSIVVWEKDAAAEAEAEASTSGSARGGHMVVVGALRGHTKAILCLAVVSDLVCSGSADKTVRIWRRGVGRIYSCLAVMDGHRGPVKCLTATTDHYISSTTSGSSYSYLVYSGSLDSDMKVWQISVPFS